MNRRKMEWNMSEILLKHLAATAYHSCGHNSTPKFKNNLLTERHGILLTFLSPYHGSSVLCNVVKLWDDNEAGGECLKFVENI